MLGTPTIDRAGATVARMTGSGQIETVGIVGAGFMGSGIAESAARAGLDVVLHEPSEGPLDASRGKITQSLDRAITRGKVSSEEADALVGRISWTTSFDDLGRADLVVEAIVEDADIKAGLFSQLDALLPEHALLASNTSSIPIAQLAAATKHPGRVLGLHFFSPVPVMPLVEVVVALDTDPSSVDRAEAFAAAIGKHAIRTKDRSGFIVNMLLVPYLMAAVRMYEEGFASREDIDEGMKRGAGHPMGPLELCDFIGLDVLYAICNSLYEEFKQTEYAPPPGLKRMVVSGHLGRKTGRGFYDYAPKRAAVTA
jgi:3-hydroxybutyryl-CoA dehydrogenase